MIFLIKAKSEQISLQDQKPGCALFVIAWLLSQHGIFAEWHRKAPNHQNRIRVLQNEDKIVISAETFPFHHPLLTAAFGCSPLVYFCQA